MAAARAPSRAANRPRIAARARLSDCLRGSSRSQSSCQKMELTLLTSLHRVETFVASVVGHFEHRVFLSFFSLILVLVFVLGFAVFVVLLVLALV